MELLQRRENSTSPERRPDHSTLPLQLSWLPAGLTAFFRLVLVQLVLCVLIAYPELSVKNSLFFFLDKTNIINRNYKQ